MKWVDAEDVISRRGPILDECKNGEIGCKDAQVVDRRNEGTLPGSSKHLPRVIDVEPSVIRYAGEFQDEPLLHYR